MKVRNNLKKCCDHCCNFVADVKQPVKVPNGPNEIEIDCKDSVRCETYADEKYHGYLVPVELDNKPTKEKILENELYQKFLTQFSVSGYQQSFVEEHDMYYNLTRPLVTEDTIVVKLKNGAKIVYIPPEEE